jgi:hypothetical protein
MLMAIAFSIGVSSLLFLIGNLYYDRVLISSCTANEYLMFHELYYWRLSRFEIQLQTCVSTQKEQSLVSSWYCHLVRHTAGRRYCPIHCFLNLLTDHLKKDVWCQTVIFSLYTWYRLHRVAKKLLARGHYPRGRFTIGEVCEEGLVVNGRKNQKVKQINRSWIGSWGWQVVVVLLWFSIFAQVNITNPTRWLVKFDVISCFSINFAYRMLSRVLIG